MPADQKSHVPQLSSTTPTFVGRSDILDILNAAFGRAQTGKTQFVFIQGEPGIGKTRVIEEFIGTATQQIPTTLVLRGRGFDLNHAGDAYGILVQILEAAQLGKRKRSNTSSASKLLKDIIPAWLGAVPIIGGIASASATTLTSLLELKTLDELNNQTHLFQKVSEILGNLSSNRPLIVFADDLHWSDTASLSAINFLANNLPDKRILFIGAYRSTAPSADVTVLNQVVTELESRNLATVLTVTRLSLAEMQEMIQAIVPNHFDGHFYQSLYARSGGNPFFVRELINLFVLRGEIKVDRQGKWNLVNPLDDDAIPTTVDSLLQQRISLLSTDLRQLCELAAVEGTRFALLVVMSIIESEERLSKTRVLQELSEIEKRFQLICQDGQQARLDFYRFVHGLIREVLYQSLNAPLRQHYHELIAERLESLVGAQGGFEFDIAQHYQESGKFDAAIPHWLAAGNEQLQSYAVIEATQAFQSALSCLKQAMADRAADQAADKNKLLTLQGRALMGLAETYGVQALTPLALNSAQEAEAIWKYLGMRQEQAQALHRIGLCLSEHKDFADCLLKLDEGLELARQLQDLTLQGRILRDIGNAYIYFDGQFDKAYSALFPSIQIFEDIGDRKEWSVSMLVLGYCYYADNKNVEALSVYSKALEYAEHIKDDYRINQLLQIQALALMRAGRVDEAVAAAQRATSLALEYHIEEFKSHRILADILYEQGSYSEAEQMYGRALTYSFDAHLHVREELIAQLTQQIRELAVRNHAIAESWCKEFQELCDLRKPNGSEAGIWQALYQELSS